MGSEKSSAKRRSDEELEKKKAREEEERDEDELDEEEEEEESDADDEDEDEEQDSDSKDSDEDEDEEDEDEDEAPARTSETRPAKLEHLAAGALPPLGAAYSARNVLSIGLRELRSYFDSLVAYVVIGLSMLGLGAYFFLYQGGFWNIDRATMGRMFDAMPFALCFVVPLVTMGVLADERRSGTIELLITMPVKDSEVILGKYVAALAMCTLLLLATMVYPIAMFVAPWHLGVLDWGPVWSGYFGLFLMCAAGVSIGMVFSGLTESNVIAFFATFLAMLALYAIGYLVEPLKGAVGDTLAFLSFQSRYTPFARGLIDTRNVVYFLSIAVICLLVSFRSLESRKWK